MTCTICGQTAGFNRAITDVLSGQEVGRICRNCELDYFGRRLEMQDPTSDTCVFCEREGYYAIPKFVASIVEAEGDLVSTNETEVTDSTPQLCEYHVELMEQFDSQTDLPESPPGATGRAFEDGSS